MAIAHTESTDPYLGEGAQKRLVARLEKSLERAKAEYLGLEAAHAEILRKHAEWENDHKALLELNDRLAKVNVLSAELMVELEEKNDSLRALNARLAVANAESADLMAELEEKNEILQKTNQELARANAHAAELMATIELKDEKIQALNRSLSQANARGAELVAERELQMEELSRLNGRLKNEIRERRKAQDELLEETTKLSAMISGMEEGVVFADSRDRIVEVNEYHLRIIDRNRTELIGKSLWDLPGLPTERARGYIDGFKHRPDSSPQEVQGPWGDSELLLRLQPIYRDQQYHGCILNFIDVTELVVAREQALEASKAKSRFLANMSHELRSPLNAIIGFAQLMARGRALSAEHRENLGIIIRSGEHLQTLINQVLDMSRIEAGRATLNERDFDLYRLLDDLEDMFQLKAHDQRLQLVFTRSPEVPRYVRTDEVKLRQVLINLLNNALKFTEMGGVSVRIRSEESEAGDERSGLKDRGSRLVFEVEDTGPGIAPSELDSLFEAFVQTQTGQQAQEGTGLGLPISRQFVRLMGGEISVNSQIGRGTLFEFDALVNVVDGIDVKAKHPTRQVISLEPDQPCYRILVVDDKWSNRQLLVKLLADVGSVTQGFQVREAANGQEAVDVWEEWQPHLIWMDVRMPVMDGYEATREIKSQARLEQGRNVEPVIIALTASVLEEDRVVISSAGCDDFLRKPFREADLFEAMANHLGVRYVYEEPIDAESVVGSSMGTQTALTPAALGGLPSGLLTDLENAIVRIDLDAISTVTDQIRKHDTHLAGALETFIDEFQYADILAGITAAKEQR